MLEHEVCEAVNGESQVLVGVLLVCHAARWRGAVVEHARDRVAQREARQARALRQAVQVPFEQEVVRPAEHTCRAWQDEWRWRRLQLGDGACGVLRCALGPLRAGPVAPDMSRWGTSSYSAPCDRGAGE